MPGAEAITVADARRVAATANGHWQGAWHDDAGQSGNSDVTISIDGTRRTARVQLSLSGSLLGMAIEADTYEIDLLSYLFAADSYDIVSPQLGRLHILAGGGGSATATATAVPGAPTIRSIQISGSRIARRADASYTITHDDGRVVKGTMAWSSAGVRAAPAPLGGSGRPTTADVQSGAYAGGLLTASDLKRIFGESFDEPSANGGNAFFDIGIGVSNGRSQAISGDYVVQYSVYVGKNRALTSAFWKKQLANAPDVPGPWEAAFYYPAINTFYAHLSTDVLIVNVVRLHSTGPLTAKDVQRAYRRELNITKSLAAAIGRR